MIDPMDLLAEIEADQSTGGVGCKACRWLADQPEAERAKWVTACGNKSFSHTSIWRAMRKRGAKFSAAAVRNHRTAGHA